MSFLTGYVLGMTLNNSPKRSYHERDFEKERLEMKCRELEQQKQEVIALIKDGRFVEALRVLEK